MEKEEAIKEAIDIVSVNNCIIFEKYYKSTKGKVSKNTFISTISKTSYNLSKELNISAGTVSKLLKELFPNRITGITGEKPCSYILLSVGFKYCSKCSTVFTLDSFRKNKHTNSGYNTYCKNCHLIGTKVTQSNRQSKYRSSKLNRIMSWSELEKIKEFYTNCPRGYHVDHIIPLNGKIVSGLHVLNNLQYLKAEENCSKGNKYQNPA